jgi:DNA-binding FadR family transcriptional regulator
MATIKNVHGNTVDRIGGDIVAGRYAPGSAIPPEPLLCEELGVSRTVVREAVKSLVAKGLVSTGPKVGTRVLPADQWNWFDADVIVWQTRVGLSRDFLRDLQDLRRAVEPAAVRLAAERATPEDIAGMEAAYALMKHAIEFGGDYVTPDLRFHQGLLDAVIARKPEQAEKAIRVLIDGAREDIETVLTSGKRIPQIHAPPRRIKAAAV